MSRHSLRASLHACTLLAALLALGTSVPAAAQQQGGGCHCWYRGFEDGTEFRPEQKDQAENFAACKDAGAQSSYDAGFAAGNERGERKCPY